MSKIYLFKVLLVLTIIQITGCSQSGDMNLDTFFEKKINQANIVGLQLAYISDGELKWVGSYGLSNYETKEKVNDSTLFMIASCSKPVTALALLKLYDQQIIDLDDNINDYLPFEIHNPNYPDQTITFRMLLTHTASLKDNWDILNPLYTLEQGGDSPLQLSEYVKNYFSPSGKYYVAEKNFQKKAPGEYWEYCNMGYALIGYLIEQITDKSFPEFVREEIFSPLQMNSSFWFLNDIPHENIARPHEAPNKKEEHSEFKVLKHYGYPDYPDGQLRTTVLDYAKFLNLILNKGRVNGTQLVSQETIDLFLKVQFPEVNKWQAIAWNYNEFDNWLYYLLMPRLPSHTGVDPGVATVVSFNPERKTAAIIFANTLTTNFKGHKILYQEMVKELMKEAQKEN